MFEDICHLSTNRNPVGRKHDGFAFGVSARLQVLIQPFSRLISVNVRAAGGG